MLVRGFDGMDDSHEDEEGKYIIVHHISHAKSMGLKFLLEILLMQASMKADIDIR